MIIACSQCRSMYDVGAHEPGTPVLCKCGDILLIPDLDDMKGSTMIRNYVKRLAEDENVRMTTEDDTTGWEFRRGSAVIRLCFDSEEDQITVESVVLPVPQDDAKALELYRKILDLNYRSTGEARFAVSDGSVIVTFSRSITGLDYVEFRSAVESVSRTSDDYDDELREEFVPKTVDDSEEEIDLSTMDIDT